jgi:hypothetical protein
MPREVAAVPGAATTAAKAGDDKVGPLVGERAKHGRHPKRSEPEGRDREAAGREETGAKQEDVRGLEDAGGRVGRLGAHDTCPVGINGTLSLRVSIVDGKSEENAHRLKYWTPRSILVGVNTFLTSTKQSPSRTMPSSLDCPSWMYSLWLTATTSASRFS